MRQPIRVGTWTLLGTILLWSEVAAQAGPAISTAAGNTVDVGGLSLFVAAAGLEERAPGEPVVIFESGAGTSLERWGSVYSNVAALGPVIAYDRPGVGRSAWDSIPPSPEHISTILRGLLYELNAPPPYVLVGHSWGGVLARYFATEHSDELVGVVYIDPTEFMRPVEDVFPILRAVGAAVPDLDPAAPSGASQSAQQGPLTPSQTRRAAIREFLNSQYWVEARPDPPEIPTALIARVVMPPETDGIRAEVGQDGAREYVALFQRALFAKLQRWLPSTSKSWFINAGVVGHFIHDAEPVLVVDAIRQILIATQP